MMLASRLMSGRLRHLAHGRTDPPSNELDLSAVSAVSSDGPLVDCISALIEQTRATVAIRVNSALTPDELAHRLHRVVPKADSTPARHHTDPLSGRRSRS